MSMTSVGLRHPAARGRPGRAGRRRGAGPSLRRDRSVARAPAAGRQRLELPPDGVASQPRRARPRHVRGRLRQLVDVSPQIRTAGYCVFALEYGDRGTGDIAASAGQLARFVDAVLAATGARRVSMLGHSQGGMMPRHYVKFLGGATKVDDLVRARALQPRHDQPGRARRRRDVLPRVPPAARRLGVPAAAQRRRRDAGRRLVHGDPDPLRRGRHAVHVRLPRRRGEHRERPAPGRLSGRGHRPPLHAARPPGDPLGAPGPGPRGAGPSGPPAELRVSAHRSARASSSTT
jgi:hypothetical protein